MPHREETMDFYKVKDGNYSVELDLKKLFEPDQLNLFIQRYKKIAAMDEGFRDLTSLREGYLRYESETLLPLLGEGFKPKVLIVYGNPAVHSVKQGMFFFTKAGDNFHRSGMWKKLAKAGLVAHVKSRIKDNYAARAREANVRKLMILSGTSSPYFLVGLTTFYSLPTPAAGSEYAGVAGVEKLFMPALDKLAEAEVKRIHSYPFAKGATIVFTQKSSYDRYREVTGTTPEFWPIRGPGSGGDNLAELLAGIHHIPSITEQWSNSE